MDNLIWTVVAIGWIVAVSAAKVRADRDREYWGCVIAVLEALIGGEREARALPIPPRKRSGDRQGYPVLDLMERQGLICMEAYSPLPFPDGTFYYSITDQGRKLLGEQDR